MASEFRREFGHSSLEEISDRKKGRTWQGYRLRKVNREKAARWLSLSGGIYKRAIPNWFLNYSRETLAAFLQGLFDSDASINDDGIFLKLYSEVLAKQVHSLLSLFGILSNFSKLEKGYLIEIKGVRNWVNYHKRIGFYVDYKGLALRELVRRSESPNEKEIIHGSGDLLRSHLKANPIKIPQSLSSKFYWRLVS